MKTSRPCALCGKVVKRDYRWYRKDRFHKHCLELHKEKLSDEKQRTKITQESR